MVNEAELDAQIKEIQAVYSRYGKEDFSPVLRAYEFACQSHEGHTRKSGDPYIVHPVASARELMVIEPDITTIVATLLHDTISDGEATLPQIEALFGGEVAHIVEALDKIGIMKYRGNQSAVERLQRTLLAMAQDVRSIFVKFADRIDNLRTLQHHKNPETAQRIADETLQVYAPIAARLGLYAMKETMETLALRTLDLDGYLHVTGELAHYTLEQEQFLTQSVEKILAILPEKYRNSVTYRVKKPYSIYRKLKQNGVQSIRDIYDVFALRVIVDDISDCYAVLGIIHGHFTPLSDRFKDFIAVPKPNGYQSLHTTVLGFEGYKQPIEIQIRTRDMDQISERGTAAHVLYKIHGDTMEEAHAYDDLVQLTMDTLMEQQGSPLGKKVTFPTLFVFSPKGDVFELPHRATPIDFAYAVHTNVGYHTIGARINGRIATLDTQLHDGDIVEIITSPQTHPVPQWLDFAVSSKAKSQIGVEVKRMTGVRAHIVERGKKMLFDTFAQAGITLADDLSNFSQYYGSQMDEKRREEFYYHIGQGIRKPGSFLPRRENVKKPIKKTTACIPAQVVIGGEKQIPHQLAQCCSPVYPDDIVAVLRTGGKCMIHNANCGSLTRVNPQRMLAAYWHTGDRGRVISFCLNFVDTPGLLSRLTKVFYEMGINIVDLFTTLKEEGNFSVQARVEINDEDQSFMDRLIARIRLEIPEYHGLGEENFDKRK